MDMKLKTIAVNGIIAALYVAVSGVIQPIAFTNIQLRIPEIFNHLIVFDKRYFFGIVTGVFFANLFFSPMLPYDLYFGVGQSALALLATIFFSRLTKNIWARLLFNTGVFTFTMFLIAWELKIALDLPFFLSWLTTAAGEFIVMAIGMPLMHAIHKRVRFDKLL
jgi:uncharacterized membrane protein